MYYNLQAINDREFEYLAKDLVEKEYDLSFQIFGKGQDKGIDLRYSTDLKENKHIVQAKHYINSKYSNLKSTLYAERDKIKQLSQLPERYILFTTCSLSPQNYDEIKKIFHPYIKSTNDIYGLERIQSLLDNYHEIVKKHYKLWLASTEILDTIVNNAEHGRSDFYKEKIKKEISLFVPTKDIKTAEEKINENKFLLITGEPGIGKSTIAYYLAYIFLANGFKLIYTHDSVKEIEQLLSKSPSEKQVILFDDFLGANIYDFQYPRNSENAISGLIERIQSSQNKYLILTTRTIVLNQAEYYQEKIERINLKRRSNYELKIDQYSRFDKAQILYNHLYSSDIPASLKSAISEDNNYLKIIDHKNFSPRLVEFITSNYNLSKDFDKDTFINFVIDCLDNPKEIWKKSYQHQLNKEEKFLIQTLFSLGSFNVPMKELEESYDSRIRYEINFLGHQVSEDPFQTALRNLLDGFIKNEKGKYGYNRISFINPSVVDFLISYISESNQERRKIINSIVYPEQIIYNFTVIDNKRIILSYQELIDLYNLLEINFNTFLTHENNLERYSPVFGVLRILINHLEKEVNIEEKVIYCIQYIILNSEEIIFPEFNILGTIFLKSLPYTKIRNLIIENWDFFMVNTINSINEWDEFEDIVSIFNSYGQDLESFINRENHADILGIQLIEIYQSQLLLDKGVDEFERAHEVSIGNGYDYAISKLQEEFTEDLLNEISELGLSEFFTTSFDFKLDEEIIKHEFDSAVEAMQEHEDESISVSGSYMEMEFEKEIEAIKNLFE